MSYCLQRAPTSSLPRTRCHASLITPPPLVAHERLRDKPMERVQRRLYRKRLRDETDPRFHLVFKVVNKFVLVLSLTNNVAMDQMSPKCPWRLYRL